MPSELYQADDFILNTTGSMNNNAQSSENNPVMIEMSLRMIDQNMRLCNLPVSVFTVGNNGKQ